MLTIPAGRRAAVVAGVRTPFAKSGTALKDVTAVTLARHATKELLYRTDLPGSEVDEVIFGQVIPSVLVPNIAREVSLLPQFPKTIPAYSLNRACASGAQAIVNARLFAYDANGQAYVADARTSSLRAGRSRFRTSRSSTRAG